MISPHQHCETESQGTELGVEQGYGFRAKVGPLGSLKHTGIDS